MISHDDICEIPLFKMLAPPLRDRLVARAADIQVPAGEWIVHDGDPPFFWALLSGEVESIKLIAGAEQRISSFDPGEYFGEVPLMLGTSALTSLRATRASRLMRVDPTDFHAMVGESTKAAATLAQTLVRRVNFIRHAYASADMMQATIVGGQYDFSCHDIREFLSRNQIAFEWLDPEDPVDAEAIPHDVRNAEHPIVVFSDGSTLVDPGIRELAERLKLQTQPTADCYDVVIVGGGPAGLAASVYGGSEGLRTMMIEREAPGGQAGTSSRIENYLGFPGGVSGGDLSSRALLQAKRFGTEILVTRSVESLREDDNGYTIRLDGGDEVYTRSVVVATGVAWRKLDADGVERLTSRGVYYGASRTEALGSRGKDVFLIGGGNSAGQAAMFFSSYARSVTLLVRGSSLDKSMSHYLIEQLATRENIAVETETVLAAARGGYHLERIVTRTGDGEERERNADALFVFIGADAETDWLPPDVQRDKHGYVLTGRDIRDWKLGRPPFPLETSAPGIFAAGDVRSASVKRVAAGVGEGSMVVAFIHQYLEAAAA